MRRVIRVAVLVVVLFLLGLLVWTQVTPEGRDAADGISDQWQQWRHGAEEQDAAEKLTAMGARFGRSAQPEEYRVAIECNAKTLGDEGYRLIGKCFRLKATSFFHCDLNDDRMLPLGGLRNLTSLVVYECPEVTDAGIKNIASLRRLVGLNLQGTSVGDASLPQIGQLPELANLNLSGTRVTDAGLPALSKLPKLEALYLMNTAVTDDGVAKLEGLPRLRQIYLAGSKVTDKGKALLMKMFPKLTITEVTSPAI